MRILSALRCSQCRDCDLSRYTHFKVTFTVHLNGYWLHSIEHCIVLYVSGWHLPFAVIFEINSIQLMFGPNRRNLPFPPSFNHRTGIVKWIGYSPCCAKSGEDRREDVGVGVGVVECQLN